MGARMPALPGPNECHVNTMQQSSPGHDRINGNLRATQHSTANAGREADGSFQTEIKRFIL
jgi:hypothetical protein